MKNHFIFAYVGNKREEVETIYNKLDFENITTIIEPYCGSSAMSYYISLKQPLKYKYILNDRDNLLIELYNIMKDTEKLEIFEKEINILCKTLTKTTYKDLIKENTPHSYYISHKIYNFCIGLFPLDYTYKKIDIKNCPIIKFLQTENIEILNNCGLSVIDLYKNNIESLLLCDPPYINTENSFYNYGGQTKNIYEWCHNNFNVEKNILKCRIYFILERNWITDLLFINLNNFSYNKKYTGFKKKISTHIIYSNYNLL